MREIIEYFKSFGVDANTTATALLTIITFTLGLFFAWLGRQFILWKEKMSYKKSLTLILKDFSKACKQQVKVVTQSLEQSSLAGGNDFKLNYIPIGTLDYLNRLDFTVFLKNFEPFLFKKNYSKAISKLFGLIAQIKAQTDSISSTLQTFMSAYKGYEKEYNENLDLLRKIHDTLAVKLHGLPRDNSASGEFIQQYFIIFGYYAQEEPDLSPTATHKNVVLKILELNRKYNTQLSLETSDHALKCDYAFINIEKVDSLLFQKFKLFAHFHKRAGKLIDVIIKIID